MITDYQIRVRLADYLATASCIPADQVIKRWKLDFTANDWNAILRSISDGNLVNGWYITRRNIKSNRVMTNHRWEYQWEYKLLYFYSYSSTGVGDQSSEQKVNGVVEAVQSALEAQPQLGFTGDTDGVDGHDELQATIDLIKSTVHVADCTLVVHLTKQL